MIQMVQKCPQYSDYYCPHYRHNQNECEAAKNSGITCVHVKAARRATLSLRAMMALSTALGREREVINLMQMVVRNEIESLPWEIEDLKELKLVT
jgi:hypothetical protein